MFNMYFNEDQQTSSFVTCIEHTDRNALGCGCFGEACKKDLYKQNIVVGPL